MYSHIYVLKKWRWLWLSERDGLCNLQKEGFLFYTAFSSIISTVKDSSLFCSLCSPISLLDNTACMLVLLNGSKVVHLKYVWEQGRDFFSVHPNSCFLTLSFVNFQGVGSRSISSSLSYLLFFPPCDPAKYNRNTW